MFRILIIIDLDVLDKMFFKTDFCQNNIEHFLVHILVSWSLDILFKTFNIFFFAGKKVVSLTFKIFSKKSKIFRPEILEKTLKTSTIFDQEVLENIYLQDYDLLLGSP